MCGQMTAIPMPVKLMINLDQELQGVKTVAILGHIRPDGDCIGSCLALYNYIETYYPEISAKVYLQDFMPEFLMLKNADQIVHDWEEAVDYDLCVSLDSADRERHGAYIGYFDRAKRTIGIDHHVSNQGFADNHLIVSDASATAEIVYDLIGKERLTKDIASCLYLGMAHDTGIFQYSNTSAKTLRAAADLLETGIEASRIIDETFYQKSYAQNRILGKTLMESVLLAEGKIAAGVVTREDLALFGVTPKELDGIVSQLRYTRGAEVAVFLYELSDDSGSEETAEQRKFKVSLRSNGAVNVSEIAGMFGGGGHVKAAGCELTGTVSQILEKLEVQIKAQL